MSDAADHLRYAEQAFHEGQKLQQTTKYRWGTVAYFYAALHMVHWALPQMAAVPINRQHPEAHTGSEGVQTLVRIYLPKLDIPYRSLFNESLSVRYHGGEVAKGQIEHFRQDDLPAVAVGVCDEVHNPDCTCWLRGL